MCCGTALAGTLNCAKGNNNNISIYFSPYTGGIYTDSVNYYKSQGYTCSYTVTSINPDDAFKVCGKLNIEHAEASYGCVVNDGYAYYENCEP